jgi:hypothetical protein
LKWRFKLVCLSQQGYERGLKGSTVFDESVVKIHKTQKLSELFGRLGEREVENDLHLLFQREDAIFAYVVAQKI